jgi:hypothetical protein
VRRLQDELVAKTKEIAQLKKEIQTLNTLQRRQSKAIQDLDFEKGNLPRLINDLTNENRVLKDKLREYQQLHVADEKMMQEQHEDNLKLRDRISELHKILKSHNLDETKVGKLAKKTVEQKDKEIEDLRHKVYLLNKVKEQDDKKFQQRTKENQTEMEKLNSELAIVKELLKKNNLGHLLKLHDIVYTSPVKNDKSPVAAAKKDKPSPGKKTIERKIY